MNELREYQFMKWSLAWPSPPTRTPNASVIARLSRGFLPHRQFGFSPIAAHATVRVLRGVGVARSPAGPLRPRSGQFPATRPATGSPPTRSPGPPARVLVLALVAFPRTRG